MRDRTESGEWAEKEPKWGESTFVVVFDSCWDLCYPGRGLNSKGDPAGGMSCANSWERQKILVMETEVRSNCSSILSQQGCYR